MILNQTLIKLGDYCMSRKWMFLIYTVLLVLLMVGCSGEYDNGGNDNGAESSIIIADSNRKIIYTAHLSIKTSDLLETTNEVKALLEAGDWIESEDLGSGSNYLAIRILTSRLNDFIDLLRGDYETTNFRLESKDVSLDYVDTTARKDALELERARLVELYESANINEMIAINERIGEIDAELIKLERRIADIDSLVEYSTVNVWIYGPLANPNPPSYGSQLQNSFIAGWNSVVAICQFFLQAIVFLVPFLVIVVPVGGIIGFGLYFKRKKANKDKNKDSNNDQHM